VSATQQQTYLGLLLAKLGDTRLDSAIQDSRKYWERFFVSTKYIVFILVDPGGSAV